MFLESKNKIECYGCRACEEICPKSCIHMEQDGEGFLYPRVDKNLCIECDLCKKTCPNGYIDYFNKEKVKACVGIHRSENIEKSSSSGGAFTALTEVLLKNKYVICGCQWTSDLRVVHELADTVEKCKAFRKSKYVQSDLKGIYRRIAELLVAGSKVAFSGTPCQVAAINSYLHAKKINTDNLLTIGLVCHGVPNQFLFDCYRQEKKDKIKEYTFKSKIKKNGEINTRTAYMKLKSGKEKIVSSQGDPFLKGYYSRLFYRPSCGGCEFSRQDRVADITLGDAWKIDSIYPELNPVKGVSLVLAGSEKGYTFIDSLKEYMDIKKIDSKWALESQRVLNQPTIMHENRDYFFELLPKIGFKKAVFGATRVPFIKRVFRYLVRKGKLLRSKL